VIPDRGVVPGHGVHERREAGQGVVAGRRCEVGVRAASQEGAYDRGQAEAAGDAERSHAIAVDGVGGCEGRLQVRQVS
jgi:hypothetical protein